ncbi:MAG: ribosomal protein S18-alanine N-acetyltransferase [Veillonellaceae bacterium]|jgi:ribosomal-protein-alanine N-acetyltransferase|nr:ribosomal protein S18-alanine N-acetyltransferase [Veillonellaceae bacterium]
MHMSDVCIRPMEAKDIDAVLEVERQSFDTPWSREAFENEVDNDLAYYLILVNENRVIGYGGMWIIVDEAHITNIALLPAYREKGLGKRLLSAMISLAKDKGARSMTLEVRVSNTPAKKLYDSFGFEECGLRQGYYTDNNEDALIMWLKSL